MKTEIKEFIENLNMFLEEPVEGVAKPVLSFRVLVQDEVTRTSRGLMELDTEDLNYFYNKYAPKVFEEFEENKKELEEAYKNITV